jgi:hypothetical protein
MSNTDNVVAEIRTLENEFKAGRISASELKELLEDIKYSKAIVAAADDLALKAQLFEMIDGIITAASAI